jgi:phosphohistidine phosphatase
MAERLRHRLSPIDGFYSSPALRAKTTAQKFAEAYHFPQQKIVFEHSLYLASAATLTSYIASIKEPYATIALFSHNPGITDFANSFYSGVRTDNIPTCGIFAVKAPIHSWAEFPASKKEFLFFDYPSLHR